MLLIHGARDAAIGSTHFPKELSANKLNEYQGLLGSKPCLPASLKNKIEYYLPDWRAKRDSIIKEIKLWGQTLKQTFIKFVVLFLVVVIGYMIILVLIKSEKKGIG